VIAIVRSANWCPYVQHALRNSTCFRTYRQRQDEVEYKAHQ